MNPDWEKFLNASINKYFDAASSLDGIKQYVLGEDIDIVGADEWIEVRNGSTAWTESTKDHWTLQTTINLMISVKKSLQGYRIHELSGLVSALFQTIPINDSDGNLICCLNQKNKIQVTDWGEMSVGSNAPVRVLNKSVESLYIGEM